jgi:hypothetical protein
LFYFLDAERTLQHEQAPVLVAAPFQQFSGNFSSPYYENNLMAKADYQFPHSVHAFYRFSYFQNSFVTNGALGFSVYDGKNVTRTHVGGLDFNTGSFTHSIRFGYLKTGRDLGDGTRATSLPLANYPLNLQMGNTGLVTGPNINVPQLILQSDHQIKYDGSAIWGPHIIRYGFSFNRIAAAGDLGGSLAPTLSTNIGTTEMNFAAAGSFTCTATSGATVSGASCPLNYPVEAVSVSNGLGYVTQLRAEICKWKPERTIFFDAYLLSRARSSDAEEGGMGDRCMKDTVHPTVHHFVHPLGELRC